MAAAAHWSRWSIGKAKRREEKGDMKRIACSTGHRRAHYSFRPKLPHPREIEWPCFGSPVLVQLCGGEGAELSFFTPPFAWSQYPKCPLHRPRRHRCAAEVARAAPGQFLPAAVMSSRSHHLLSHHQPPSHLPRHRHCRQYPGRGGGFRPRRQPSRPCLVGQQRHFRGGRSSQSVKGRNEGGVIERREGNE